MNQQALIEVAEREIGGEIVQSADGRALHVFLGIVKDFNQWMREQVARGRLVEDRDYLTYEVVVQLPSGAKRRNEYSLTIDAAKHIAMMSFSEKGFEVREYFIECERRAKHNAPALDLNDPTFLRTMLLGYTEKVIALEAKVQADAPKVDFHDRYAVSEGNKGFREVCKLLCANEREFRQFLISNSIMYRLNGRLMPMAHHQHAGRFDVKAGISDANNHAFNQAMFTPKGIAWVSAEWAKYQAATV